MANPLNRIAKFITSTSLLLAIDGPLIVVFGYFLYGNQISITILSAAFLAVFAIYNLNKATDKTEDAINRPETANKPTIYYIVFSFAAIFLSLALGATVSLLALAVLITPLAIGMLYSVRISRSLPRLKEITGIKSLLVALSWSLYGTFLPLISQSASIEMISLIFIYLFIQVFVNTVLFDFLDMTGDLFTGNKTLPIALEKNRTRNLLLLSNNALWLWLVFCGLNGLFLSFMPALIFGVIYCNFNIMYFSKEKTKRLHAELIIDGEWLPIIALMKLTL